MRRIEAVRRQFACKSSALLQEFRQNLFIDIVKKCDIFKTICKDKVNVDPAAAAAAGRAGRGDGVEVYEQRKGNGPEYTEVFRGEAGQEVSDFSGSAAGSGISHAAASVL